jgi:hypothetical protein
MKVSTVPFSDPAFRFSKEILERRAALASRLESFEVELPAQKEQRSAAYLTARSKWRKRDA